MCAGISGLYAAGATVAALRTQLPLAIAYNTGRILSYAIIGSALALAGRSIVSLLPTLAAPVRIASGLLIVAIGLQVAFNWRLLAPVERVGSRLWSKLAPHAQGLIPATTLPRAAGLGLIWGLLPCGLVYSALLISASAADPLTGGVAMFAFGIGTLPAMLISGLGASKLSAFMSRNRLGAGLLIVLLGIATLVMPLMSVFGESGNHGHMHHSAAL
jgi:sulfite exporter TauE/SafE